mgnify:CR=1 FL=1
MAQPAGQPVQHNRNQRRKSKNQRCRDSHTQRGKPIGICWRWWWWGCEPQLFHRGRCCQHVARAARNTNQPAANRRCCAALTTVRRSVLMRTINMPKRCVPSARTMTQQTTQRVAASNFSGIGQAVDLLNDRWLCSMTLPLHYNDNMA